MFRLIIRRLVLGLITVMLVSAIIFAGVEMLPGDACTAFLEREAQGVLLENCRRDLDLNRPAMVRYLDWVSGAVRGDFGLSANGQKSIAELVGSRLQNTLLLALCAMAIGVRWRYCWELSARCVATSRPIWSFPCWPSFR